jgi:hypothetical protein
MAARLLTAGSARGPGAARRWCQPGAARWCAAPLQAQECAVAQPSAPADAPREEAGALRSTGTLAGGRLSGWPLRALTPPMPGSGRWRPTAARLALCRSRAASPVSTGGNRSCPEDRPGTHAYRRVFACADCIDCPVVCAQIRLLWRAAGRCVKGPADSAAAGGLPPSGRSHRPGMFGNATPALTAQT